MTANPKIRFLVAAIEDGRPTRKKKLRFQIYIQDSLDWALDEFSAKKFLTSEKI